MTRATGLVPLVVLSMALAPSTQAQRRAKGKREPIDPAGIARLIADSGGGAQVSVSEATGAARFVRTAPGEALGLLKQAERAASSDAKKDQSTRFFEAYGSVFGISDASSELQAAGVAPRYIEKVLAAFGPPAAAPAVPLSQPGAASPAAMQEAPAEMLTNREIDVLALLAQRLSDKEIADRLVLSPLTIKKHTQRIYRKLGVRGRRAAVAQARRLGLV